LSRGQDNQGAVAYQSLSITSTLSITTSSLPPGVIGQPPTPVSRHRTPHTRSCNLDRRASGLTIQADGHIVGTPTQTNYWSLGARVRDGSFQTVSKTINNLCINQPLDITSPTGLTNTFLKE
jgi:hypothetical protein